MFKVSHAANIQILSNGFIKDISNTVYLGFDPGSVHVAFVVDKVALGQVFPPSTSVFPCQFHSTGTPLHGKTKNTIHLHHRVAQ
jgi:hypothetical protein